METWAGILNLHNIFENSKVYSASDQMWTITTLPKLLVTPTLDLHIQIRKEVFKLAANCSGFCNLHTHTTKTSREIASQKAAPYSQKLKEANSK